MTLLPSLPAACQCCCSRGAPSAVSLLSDLSSRTVAPREARILSTLPNLESDKIHQRRSRVQVVSTPNCSSTSPVFFLCCPVPSKFPHSALCAAASKSLDLEFMTINDVFKARQTVYLFLHYANCFCCHMVLVQWFAVLLKKK